MRPKYLSSDGHPPWDGWQGRQSLLNFFCGGVDGNSVRHEPSVAANRSIGVGE